MKKFLRDNSLSIVTLGLFILFWVGQAISGFQAYLEAASDNGWPVLGFMGYLGSGHFLEATFENWESEFLQMALYVALTAFLFQRGSAESKDPDEDEKVDEDPREHRRDPKAPMAVRKGGLLLRVYSHSLSLALGLLFVLCFASHALGGLKQYNVERTSLGKPAESLWGYLSSSQFWFESFQNWQSEFLAVGAIVILSIFLRQRGSPESKPVFAPHSQTGE